MNKLIYKVLYILTPIKSIKIKFKNKYKDASMNAISNKLSKSVSFLELPTIKDSRNHLIKHFDDTDYTIINGFNKKERRKALKSSKIIVSEGAFNKKFKNQTAIEIWHSSGFIKSAANLSADSNSSCSLDYVVCPSEGVKELYSKAFGVNEDKVLCYGSVKTDFIFDKEICKNMMNEFYIKYPVLKNKKIYSWAPTFRGDWNNNPRLFSNLDLDIINKKLSDDEVLLIKLHPSIKYFNDNISSVTNLLPQKHHNKIINVTDDDLSSVILASDCFISDYSSSILDAIVANKSVVFFAEDLQEYSKDRGFPFNYKEEVPNLLEKCTEEQFLQALRNANSKSKKYIDFKKKWVGNCDGKAGKRIKNLIKELLNEK